MDQAKATARNVSKVLRNFADWLDDPTQDKETKKQVALGLNAWLDSLSMDDFFGTEGQCDPRGDRRNLE